jgi:hypothetical protein
MQTISIFGILTVVLPSTRSKLLCHNKRNAAKFSASAATGKAWWIRFSWSLRQVLNCGEAISARSCVSFPSLIASLSHPVVYFLLALLLILIYHIRYHASNTYTRYQIPIELGKEIPVLRAIAAQTFDHGFKTWLLFFRDWRVIQLMSPGDFFMTWA